MFPESRKHAIVVPVLETGVVMEAKTVVQRLLCQLSLEVLEKVIAGQLSSHLEDDCLRSKTHTASDLSFLQKRSAYFVFFKA